MNEKVLIPIENVGETESVKYVFNDVKGERYLYKVYVILKKK